MTLQYSQLCLSFKCELIYNFLVLSNLTLKLETDKNDLVLPIKLMVYSLRYLPASHPDHVVIISERDISL